MNTTIKVSRVMLFLSACILPPTLSSCAQVGGLVGGEVVKYAVTEGLNCVTKDECPTAKAESKATPEKAIEDYYQLINERQYGNAWSVLTRRFQDIEPDNNYKNFEGWWDSVDSVKIDSVKLLEKSDARAIVYTDLRYLMKGGRQINDSSKITLILSSNGKWLIDAKTKS
jgi:hypothetical protein